MIERDSMMFHHNTDTDYREALSDLPGSKQDGLTNQIANTPYLKD